LTALTDKHIQVLQQHNNTLRSLFLSLGSDSGDAELSSLDAAGVPRSRRVADVLENFRKDLAENGAAAVMTLETLLDTFAQAIRMTNRCRPVVEPSVRQLALKMGVSQELNAILYGRSP
jgi:hypothetical protein